MTQGISRTTIAATFALTALAAVALTAAQTPPMKSGGVSQTAATVTITLSTKPSPPLSGDNVFEVTVANTDGTPVVNADILVQLLMPAMPMMSMPEMKRSVALKAADGADAKPGTYAGLGEIPMPGRWNVTIVVTVDGRVFAEKKLTLSAK